MKIEQIQSHAQNYAAARLALITTVQEYQDAQQLLKDKHWPRIKPLALDTAEARHDLAAQIEAYRGLFDNPRTIIVDGIKLGLRKAKGKMEFDDETMVIERIKEHFRRRAGELIRITESVRLDALQTLSAIDLKKLGITITETGDEVIIKPIDGDMEKLVNACMKDVAE